MSTAQERPPAARIPRLSVRQHDRAVESTNELASDRLGGSDIDLTGNAQKNRLSFRSMSGSQTVHSGSASVYSSASKSESSSMSMSRMSTAPTDVTSAPSLWDGKSGMTSSSKSKGEKKKRSNMLGFLSLKEPSTAAFEQYAAQQRKLALGKGVRMTAVGMPGVSSQKLPLSVPKVNSKWDGLPERPKSNAPGKGRGSRDSFATYGSGSGSGDFKNWRNSTSTSTFGSNQSIGRPTSLDSGPPSRHVQGQNSSTDSISDASGDSKPPSMTPSMYSLQHMAYFFPAEIPPVPAVPRSSGRSECATPPDQLPSTPRDAFPISSHPKQKSLPLLSPQTLHSSGASEDMNGPRSPSIIFLSADDDLVPPHLIRERKSDNDLNLANANAQAIPPPDGTAGPESTTKAPTSALLSPDGFYQSSRALRRRGSADATSSTPTSPPPGPSSAPLGRPPTGLRVLSRPTSTVSLATFGLDTTKPPKSPGIRPNTSASHKPRPSAKRAEVAPWEAQAPDGPDEAAIGPQIPAVESLPKKKKGGLASIFTR